MQNPYRIRVWTLHTGSLSQGEQKKVRIAGAWTAIPPCRQAVQMNKSRPTLSPGMPSYWHLFGETSRVPTVCSCFCVVHGLVWGRWVKNTGVLHALSMISACLPCTYYGILMNLRRGRPGFFFGPGRGQPPALVSMVVAITVVARYHRKGEIQTEKPNKTAEV